MELCFLQLFVAWMIVFVKIEKKEQLYDIMSQSCSFNFLIFMTLRHDVAKFNQLTFCNNVFTKMLILSTS